MCLSKKEEEEEIMQGDRITMMQRDGTTIMMQGDRTITIMQESGIIQIMQECGITTITLGDGTIKKEETNDAGRWNNN